MVVRKSITCLPPHALLIAKAVRVICVVSGIRHPVTSLSYLPLTIASLGMTLAIQLTSELVPHVAPSSDAFLCWSVRLHDLQFVFCAGHASAGRPFHLPFAELDAASRPNVGIPWARLREVLDCLGHAFLVPPTALAGLLIQSARLAKPNLLSVALA